MESKHLDRHWLKVKENYKLTEVLGQGTFGKVVAAKERKTGKKVAIKFISARFDSKENVKAILRELTILR
jgi:serine/threonine protein kinase